MPLSGATARASGSDWQHLCAPPDFLKPNSLLPVYCRNIAPRAKERRVPVAPDPLDTRFRFAKTNAPFRCRAAVPTMSALAVWRRFRATWRPGLNPFRPCSPGGLRAAPCSLQPGPASWKLRNFPLHCQTDPSSHSRPASQISSHPRVQAPFPTLPTNEAALSASCGHISCARGVPLNIDKRRICHRHRRRSRDELFSNRVTTRPSSQLVHARTRRVALDLCAATLSRRDTAPTSNLVRISPTHSISTSAATRATNLNKLSVKAKTRHGMEGKNAFGTTFTRDPIGGTARDQTKSMTCQCMLVLCDTEPAGPIFRGRPAKVREDPSFLACRPLGEPRYYPPCSTSKARTNVRSKSPSAISSPAQSCASPSPILSLPAVGLAA